MGHLPNPAELRVALISGGMYDRLYTRIPEFEASTGLRVNIAFRGTHPELNAHLATAEVSTYDLVSTHTKYAPSQWRLLAPLDDFDCADFFPALLELATAEGSLRGVPRNIDVRLLHYRTDLLDDPPATWDELLVAATRAAMPPQLYGFVLPGKDSGLFGTFYELAESAGARLFTRESNRDAARWALDFLRRLYAGGVVPRSLTGWHYDEVHRFFRDGRAAMTGDWPGYYGSYCAADSSVRDLFAVARMPAGPARRVRCIAGCHTFALTHAGARKEAAHEFLRFLTAPEHQALEAFEGSVPVRRSVMEQQRRSAHGAAEDRLALLKRSIDCDILRTPKTASYARIENSLWPVVQAAMTGALTIPDALTGIEAEIRESMLDAA